MNTKLSKLVVAMGALVMAGGAFAVDTQTTMTTTAVVPAACVISNATTIALGTLTMLDASVETHNTASDSTNTGSFKATCTNGTTGAAFSYTSAKASTTTPTGFTMTTGTFGEKETMVYSLYPSTDASGMALVEGAATAYSSFVADGTQKTLNLSVKILAAEKATKKVGTYTDTVTIDVTFTAS